MYKVVIVFKCSFGDKLVDIAKATKARNHVPTSVYNKSFEYMIISGEYDKVPTNEDAKSMEEIVLETYNESSNDKTMLSCVFDSITSIVEIPNNLD